MEDLDDWDNDDEAALDEAQFAAYFADEIQEGEIYSAEVGKALRDCDVACSQSVFLTSIVLLMFRAKRKRQREMRVAVAWQGA